MTDPRRVLPSVDRLLNEPGIRALLGSAPRNLVVAAVREAIGAARRGRAAEPEDWVADVAERVARRASPSLHPVLNATGVILHTNLGRAPLARRALEAIRAVGAGYSTLEFDSATGTRGSRNDHCASLLAALAGSEDALVVNNAAGINHVHISENDRGVPGTGHVHWAETFSALKAVGYDSWLTIESFGRALPELAAATCIWRDLFDSEEQVASEGIRFVRESWR